MNRRNVEKKKPAHTTETQNSGQTVLFKNSSMNQSQQAMCLNASRLHVYGGGTLYVGMGKLREHKRKH